MALICWAVEPIPVLHLSITQFEYHSAYLCIQFCQSLWVCFYRFYDGPKGDCLYICV